MKSLVKSVVFTLGTVATSPLWAWCLLHRAIAGGNGPFRPCGELLSLVPGRVGSALRCGFYRMCVDSISADCTIGFGTYFSHRQVSLGRRVYIGNGCTMGKVAVGDDALIGSNVDILSGRHQHGFEDASKPLLEQGGTYQQVRLGAHAWIGNSAVVMADVGASSIVGAGSVVVKPIPPMSVAVGNPARVIRERATPAMDAAPNASLPQAVPV